LRRALGARSGSGEIVRARELGGGLGEVGCRRGRSIGEGNGGGGGTDRAVNGVSGEFGLTRQLLTTTGAEKLEEVIIVWFLLGFAWNDVGFCAVRAFAFFSGKARGRGHFLVATRAKEFQQLDALRGLGFLLFFRVGAMVGVLASLARDLGPGLVSRAGDFTAAV